MLKKIYLELVDIGKALQAIRSSLERPVSHVSKNGIEQTILYADNEMYLQELRISLSALDWYKLQKQACFQELKKYLDSLQTQKSADNLHAEKG